MSMVRVRNIILGVGSENISARRMQLSRLSWAGHVLQMANTRLLCGTQFSVSLMKWKKPCVSQQMTTMSNENIHYVGVTTVVHDKLDWPSEYLA